MICGIDAATKHAVVLILYEARALRSAIVGRISVSKLMLYDRVSIEMGPTG